MRQLFHEHDRLFVFLCPPYILVKVLTQRGATLAKPMQQLYRVIHRKKREIWNFPYIYKKTSSLFSFLERKLVLMVRKGNGIHLEHNMKINNLFVMYAKQLSITDYY